MNSIFFRIYGGILVVLISVSMVGLLGIQLVNGVRAEDYRERVASGTFRLMADNLAPMDDSERQRVLRTWSRLIGVPLELKALDELALETSLWSRLVQGQVLVRIRDRNMRVYALVEPKAGVVLTTTIQRISEQLGRATLYLIADELVRHPDADMPTRLAELVRDKKFGFPLALTPIANADLDPDQRRRLEESDTVMTLGPDGDSVLLYMKIPESSWVLSLGPLFQMDDYPPGLVLITVIMVLSFSGLFIYLLVRQLEQRLRTLERAASHITKGNLDARVVASTNDSVGRLARAFNEMASHLQRLMRLQREMLGAVSHELRTPVARLRFGLEMLGTANSDADRARYTEGMDSDLSELDRLVDEILTYARLEQGAPALSLAPTDIPALVARVVKGLGPLSHSIELYHVDETNGQAGEVEAEARYLMRGVNNLVNNAMRHAASRVCITTRLVGDECQIVVEDDGPGVPEAFHERIFTPFLRLDDSRMRSAGGYGLGLAIVRRVIYWHKGRVRVEHSASLGGAAFVLEWPRRRESA